MIIRMDLADTPAPDREEHLDSVTSRDCPVPFRSRCADRTRPMTFVHTQRMFGDLTIFENVYSNYSGTRPVGVERSSDPKMITIGIPLGPMGFEQGDRQVRASAQSMVGFWGYLPYRAEVRQEITYTALAAPADSLGLPKLLVRNVTGVDIGASPLAAVFASHVRTLLALPEITAREETALEGPTLELLRSLLVTAAGDEFAAREPLERTLELRAMAFLETHFTQPDLSVERLARHLGVSRTRAFAVLRRMGIAFSEWVKNRRLSRAAELLTAPATSLVPIGDIANMVGIPDPATFARAFRSRFGQSPSAWRAGHHSPGGTAPLVR
jgi:AraC-like DNA-binding protein